MPSRQSFVPGASAGVGATATIVTQGGDVEGVISLTTGTGPAAGSTLGVLTLGGWAGYEEAGSGLIATGVKVIHPLAYDAATAALGIFVVSATFNTITLGCTSAPAATTVYRISWLTAPSR